MINSQNKKKYEMHCMVVIVEERCKAKDRDRQRGGGSNLVSDTNKGIKYNC